MDIENEHLDALLQLWRSRRPESRLPARSDFKFVDFRPFFGHLAIGRVWHDPIRIRADLIGTQIVEQVDGRDLTGQFLEEAMPEPVRNFILYPIHKCIKTGQVIYDRASEGKFSPITLQRLVLPLADDGQLIDRVLVAVYAQGRESGARRGALLDRFRQNGGLYQRTDMLTG